MDFKTIIEIIEWIGFGIFLYWFLTKDKKKYEKDLHDTVALGKLPRISTKDLRTGYYDDAWLRIVRGEEGEALKNLNPYDRQRAAWKIAETEAKKDGWVVETTNDFDLEKYRSGGDMV